MSDDLLLNACRAGAFGEICHGEAGSVALAGFCYLLGEPDAALTAFFHNRCAGRQYVPKSEAWVAFLDGLPGMRRVERTRMRATRGLTKRA